MVELVRTGGTGDIRAAAVRALCLLAIHDQANTNHLVDAGAVPVLLRLIRKGDEQLRVGVLTAIRNISETRTGAVAILADADILGEIGSAISRAANFRRLGAEAAEPPESAELAVQILRNVNAAMDELQAEKHRERSGGAPGG